MIVIIIAMILIITINILIIKKLMIIILFRISYICFFPNFSVCRENLFYFVLVDIKSLSCFQRIL